MGKDPARNVVTHWRTLGILSLGVLVFLFGVFTGLLGEFLNVPRLMSGTVKGGLLALGAALAAVGLWMWIIEKARLFEEVQKKSKELEQGYRARSEFLNTFAHELRTPLNVVMGSLQLLIDGFYGEVNERQKTGLEVLRRNAIDLRNLINQVLDLARIESGRVPLLLEEFTPKEMIDDLKSSFMPLCREKGLGLKFKLDDVLPKLKSDKSKIREILQNLLANAIKYTDGGEVELQVRALQDGQSEGPGHGRVSFSVRDTGIGIKREDIPGIFEPFRVVEEVDRRKHPGTGLGLSIVKRLVEMLEGEIQVESEWGKGSTFTIILPLVCSRQIL